MNSAKTLPWVTLVFTFGCLSGCGNWFQTKEECAAGFQKAELKACYACVDDGGVYNKSVSSCEGGSEDRQRQALAREDAARQKQAALQAAYEQELEVQRAYDAETSPTKKKTSKTTTKTTKKKTTSSKTMEKAPANVTVTYDGEYTFSKLGECEQIMEDYFAKESSSDRAEALRQCQSCFENDRDTHLWKVVMHKGEQGGYYCIARKDLE